MAVVGARKGASRNKIPSFTMVSTGGKAYKTALQGLSMGNMKGVQMMKVVKTVEVARTWCKKKVVGYYRLELYEVVYYKVVDYKVLRKDLSSLNFSLGDVAHAALLSTCACCLRQLVLADSMLAS